MTAAKKTGQATADGEPGGREAAELELARWLAERAEGLSLTGPGGLLGRLTKVVLEGALEGEMDADGEQASRADEQLPSPARGSDHA